MACAAELLSEMNNNTTETNYACEYCGVDDTSCIVMCYTCQKWYCNSRTNILCSHIIEHLMYSEHSEVALHEGRSLGESVLECYNCGTRNVFVLGIIPSMYNSNATILCRTSCVTLLDDQERWQPLISNQCFLPWLVKIPEERSKLHYRPITTHQICRWEEQSRYNRDVTFQEQEIFYEESEQAPLIFPLGDYYHYTFKNLVKLEENCHNRQKRAQAINIVRWKLDYDKNPIAYFKFAKRNDYIKLIPGDEIHLTYVGEMHKFWSAFGHIVKVPDNRTDIMALELEKCSNVPSECYTDFTIQLISKNVSFDRMKLAVFKFGKYYSNLSMYIYYNILGYTVSDILYPYGNSKDFNAPNLPQLNMSQINAVKHALEKPLSMIQGPPGTGKTVTSASIVYQFVSRNSYPVLVCAPSNTAVDQLAEKIHRTKLKVVRLYAKSREAVNSPVSFLALHNQISVLGGNTKLQKLQQLKENGELNAADEVVYDELKASAEHKLLADAHVICCTCIGAGDPRLLQLKFNTVLIDESMQATEPECVIPIVLGIKQLILVGDQCQLGPIVASKRASRNGLSRSLFERLVSLGREPFRLEIQYRMHPELSRFSSNFFYEGSLINGVCASDRKLSNIDFPWPVANKPMFFYNIDGEEDVPNSGSSFFNRVEAIIVEEIAIKFLKSGVKPQQIGIITPYEGQRAFLMQKMYYQSSVHGKLYKKVEVSSIDAFQGREKDIIIISCVRSNQNHRIGFLKDPRRLNVALTRAKYGMVIVGNAKVLSKDPLWNNLLNFYKEQKVLVEGLLNDLQESSIELAKPEDLVTARNQNFYSMSTSMFDARENMVPVSVLNRANIPTYGSQYNYLIAEVPVDVFSYIQNPFNYISPNYAEANSLPVSMGNFMNMTNISSHKRLSYEKTQPHSQSLQLTKHTSQPCLSQPVFNLSQKELSSDYYMTEDQSPGHDLLSQDSTNQED